MRPTRSKLIPAIPLVIIIGVVWLVVGWWREPTVAAYRACDECGISTAEIDKLIDDMARTNPDRVGLLSLFRATFDDAGDAEICQPRAESILDAAGVR